MYYVYAANSSLPFVKAENSESFDGFEKDFFKYGLNLDLTYFNKNMTMF